MAVTLGSGGNRLQSFPHTFASGGCHPVSLLRSSEERGEKLISTPQSVLFRVLESWREARRHLPVVIKHFKAVKPFFFLELNFI